MIDKFISQAQKKELTKTVYEPKNTKLINESYDYMRLYKAPDKKENAFPDKQKAMNKK